MQDDHVHPERRPSWRTAPLLLGPLALLTLASWAGTTSAAALVSTAPLLLVALSPRMPFLVLAATSTSPVLFIPVAVARLFVADPFNYRVGRLYGPVAVEWGRRRSRVLDRFASWTEQLMDRFGLLVVAARPNASVLMLAGSVALGWRRTLAAAFVGTVGYVVVLATTASMATSASASALEAAGSVPPAVWLPIAAAAVATVVWLVLRRRGRLESPVTESALEPAPSVGR